MKKNAVVTTSILFSIFILVCGFYIWRYSPFIPHVDRNADGTFTLNGDTYTAYDDVDFMEKFGHLKRGKKLAIINQTNDLPWCTVYEARGANSENILIVFEETIMSVDTYYVIK